MLAPSVIARDLPFPVSRLLRQSRNAKSSTEAHNRAWFAWEVSLRLAVLGGDPPLIPARRTASVGDWARALRRVGRQLESDELRRLYLHLARVVNPDAGSRTSVQRRELVDGLVAYRNRVLGHGPSRDEDFCAEGARLLRDGLVSAWSEELFWPADARLLYVESVEMQPTGEHVARVLDLGLDRIGKRVPLEESRRNSALSTGRAVEPRAARIAAARRSRRDRGGSRFDLRSAILRPAPGSRVHRRRFPGRSRVACRSIGTRPRRLPRKPDPVRPRVANARGGTLCVPANEGSTWPG